MSKIHVVPYNGAWAVKVEGNSNPLSTHNTQGGAHPTVGGLERELARMEEITKKMRRVDAPLQ